MFVALSLALALAWACWRPSAYGTFRRKERKKERKRERNKAATRPTRMNGNKPKQQCLPTCRPTGVGTARLIQPSPARKCQTAPSFLLRLSLSLFNQRSFPSHPFRCLVLLHFLLFSIKRFLSTPYLPAHLPTYLPQVPTYLPTYLALLPTRLKHLADQLEPIIIPLVHESLRKPTY
ncbi:hypothetical protein LY76DRAFT_257615 [Colletotrichum caudatum]|nr:hypothetical protein LY76DRAFT_257615 [Colletotrichum caudatum]